MKIVYLDTSAIVDLAKFTKKRYWKKLDDLLRDGNHTLVMSTTHLYEFAKGRKENDYTAMYLDTLLPYIQWIIPPWYIWEEEVKGALYYHNTGGRHEFRRLYDLFFTMYTTVNRKYRRLKYDLRQPTSVAETIEFFKKDKVYLETQEVAEYSAKMVKRIREKAVIWQSWRSTLRFHIRDCWPQETVTGLKIPFEHAFLDGLLGVADLCMPSLVFATKLHRVKYNSSERVEPNDFIDEFHASFVPYCDSIMHDKTTCRRARQTGSEFGARFTSEPEELLEILAR
ncbi:hypothetical protein KAX97_03165 [candidate division WOR-3 bacterium]|nr:hypothetical protein [candidate division WOR-3 bacterium]